MKLFSREEIELLKLEAGRKKIADLREKLRRLKEMATPHFEDRPSAPSPEPVSRREKR